jgi:hypothetical protein
MRTIIPLLVLATVSSAHAGRWNKVNDPTKLAKITGKAVITDFAKLPMSAKLSNSHIGWSDTYWPSMKGGIAYRWNSEPNPENFRYRLLSKNEVANLTTAELEGLSPTEKLDIYNGNYNYPVTRKVLSKYSPKDAWWEGICHGWSAAAIAHAEPKRVDLRNKDGIVVPFGSTDVKGLLSFYYAEIHKTNVYTRIGDRCKVKGKVPGEAYPQDRVRTMPSPSEANSEKCIGVNPGSFHLTLTNILGLQDRGFVADVDRFADVWNQPIVGFNSEILERLAPSSAQRAQGIARLMKVKTQMTYGEESVLLDPESAEDAEEKGTVSMNPVTGTSDQNYLSREYIYLLELDDAGKIIGGTWLSEGRPDFLWMKGAATKFGSGKGFNMSALNEIYRPVID